MSTNILSEQKKPLILIVDDVPKNLQVVGSLLTNEGYRISPATSGLQAIKMAEKMLPNLILLDINMPEMDGFEVCNKLKSLEKTEKIPIIFLTARTETDDIVKAFQTGALDYVTKPINSAELLARVKTHLELANYRMHLEYLVKQRTNELYKKNIELTNTNIAYARFVPSEFLNLLNKKNILSVHLGDNVQKEMTIFFADIRSFTALSESMTPKENFIFLNSYLEKICPVIREHDGFIDKYIGDAIMALFPNHPEDAIKASISMRNKLGEFNDDLKATGKNPIEIGIGIHTGKLMLGTIGEYERMEGTVISDAVNLASRLEGLTKVYGATTIISDNTLMCLDDPNKYNFRFLEKVKVKGKEDVVSIFEIFDTDSEKIKIKKQKSMEDFDQGIKYYYSKKFDNAIKCFKDILDFNPDDKAVYRYLNRADHFRKYGVSDDWDGTETMDSK
ncbi:MAG: response regulator [Desulfobacterales bacterium]|nr:response regulator [Desulfobacterales bacterium]